MTSGASHRPCSALAERQKTLDPDRGADGRDFGFRAERLQQPIVTAAADDGFFARALLMRLEDEARIIIEIADEARGEGECADVEPARRHEAEARIEAIEHGAQIDAGRAGERAHLRRSLVGVGFDRKKLFDELARRGRKFRTRFQRGLFEKALGDLADAAPAHGRDAGDGEKIFDKRAGVLWVDAFKRGEHARMILRRAIAADGEDRVEIFLRRIATNDFPPPLRRDVKRIDESAEDRRIADPQNEFCGRNRGDGFKREAENLGVGRLAIGSPEILNASLQKFARPIFAKTKDGSAIGIGGGSARFGALKIMLADRNCIFRPQTIIRARLIARQVKPAADVFARIEKDRGVLQDRRFAQSIASRLQTLDERRAERAKLAVLTSAVPRTIL